MELSTWEPDARASKMYARLNAARELRDSLEKNANALYFFRKLQHERDHFPLTFRKHTAFRLKQSTPLKPKHKDTLRKTLASDTGTLVHEAMCTVMQPKTLHGLALPADLGACRLALEALVAHKADELKALERALAQTRNALSMLEEFQQVAALAHDLKQPLVAKTLVEAN
jgi:hypothetical protein